MHCSWCNISKVTKIGTLDLPYFFRGQRLASEVIATRREAALDQARVHPHEILHLVYVSINAQTRVGEQQTDLLFFDDFGHMRLFGSIEC